MTPPAVDTPQTRAAVAAGDRDALAAMWRQHHRNLVGWLRRKGCDQTLAEDLASETFVRALAKRGWQEMGVTYGTWLHQIAYRLLLDHAKSAATRYTSPQGLETGNGRGELRPMPDHADEVARRVDGHPLRQALADLNPRYREVLYLRYWQDVPPREIARWLGTGVDAVKAVQQRATQRLAADQRLCDLWLASMREGS